MKFIRFKFAEIFTDGTLHFSHKKTKFSSQICFYDKDVKNLPFFKKQTQIPLLKNSSRNAYKLKYKF